MVEIKPIFAINFKAYEMGFGNNAIHTAKTIDRLAEEYSMEVIITVPLIELYKIRKEVRYVKVFGEYADPVEFGAHTGKHPVDALFLNGADGVLLNHAENKITLNTLEKILDKAKEFRMETLVCGDSDKEAKALSVYDVEYIAMEPPYLIGSEKSVSKENPEMIKKTVKGIRSINPSTNILVGAGISDRKDVEESIRLGAEGVFIASAIMKAKNIEKAVEHFFFGWEI